MNKSVYLGILKEIVENIETRLHKICLILSERDHSLKEKIKKIIWLIKDELGGQVKTNFVGLR